MGTRARQKRTEIARRRADVAAWYCRGRSVVEIAAMAGVHPATVTRDLQVIRQEWRDHARERIAEAMHRELARIDHLEWSYWKAWERSCEDAETVIVETSGDGEKRRQQRAGQSGNPAFLTGVQWCITKRLELLGAMPTKKTEISGLPGGPVHVTSAYELSDEQLAALTGLSSGDPIPAVVAGDGSAALAGPPEGQGESP